MIASDTKAVLFAAGLMFLYALLLGVLKYRQMAASPEGRAHRTRTPRTGRRCCTRSPSG